MAPNKSSIRLRFLLAPALLLVCLPSQIDASARYAPRQQAAALDSDQPRWAHLFVSVSADGGAYSTLEVDADALQEPDLRLAFATALGCPLSAVHTSSYGGNSTAMLTARCNLPLVRRRFQLSGSINPLSLQSALENADVAHLDATISLPATDLSGCQPALDNTSREGDSIECSYVIDLAGAPAEPILFSFGHAIARVERVAAVLGFLLVFPIPLTLWLRRMALRAPEEARTVVWFRYVRVRNWGFIAMLLLWWTSIDVLGADRLLSDLLPAGHATLLDFRFILPWILLWTPPTIVYLICVTLCAPIHRVRGTAQSAGELYRQSVWAIARAIFPTAFIALSVLAVSYSLRSAVLLFAAAVFTAVFTQRKILDSQGLELNALTSGELRDRTFALAAKAGVQLKQLYVIPTERIRMANAFAHRAKNIFLTDFLLNNLNKREVDAIIGHEVTHLQRGHIARRQAILVGGTVVYFSSVVVLDAWLPHWFPSGPIFVVAMLLVSHFVSRRGEFDADAGVFRLTGDAEAMITGLAKISRLNTMPIHWGKVNDKLLTHPSTFRRIEKLARLGAIPAARIPRLLEDSVAPPSDAYALPSTVAPTGKIFSSRFKSRRGVTNVWINRVALAVSPALVALAAKLMGLRSPALWIAYAAGLLLTSGVVLAVADFLPLRGHAELGKRIREKICRAGASSELGSGLFVGLAPDPSPRIYESNWFWDAGILSLVGDRLCYWGEEARFALRRAEISKIALGPGPDNWFRIPSLYVTWRDRSGREEVFNLRPMGSKSMRRMARDTRSLFQELEDWRLGRLPQREQVLVSLQPSSTTAAALQPPNFGRVTSAAPGSGLRPRNLVNIWVFASLVAVGVAIVFGLDFSILSTLEVDLANALNTPHRQVQFDHSGWYVLLVVWTNFAIRIVRSRVARKRELRQRTPATGSVSPVPTSESAQ